ncbi:EDD domain protein, DegV family [Bacillus sp. 491mf]|uniref:DegV family protein n=1 Tax=Bacillus sp. 491mf TaxID=1761755 RepID=UPI0008F2167F|nr:DegV family protein [Bacillus sp. 491mf]SFC97208.1 EDD domain protein, DegV family [Bacillus sp. 491mf]
MKIAIVTDSTAYIPKHVREELQIHMIPLNVILGNESYQEEMEITAEDFYEKVREQGELAKTSQPAIGEFIKLFEELGKEYDAVISIHLSSGISGTYQTATTAGQMVEGVDVYTYDSEISCEVQGFYVREGAKMASEGKSPEEILSRFDEMKKTMDAYFVVDDLHHLQRGGRLNSAQAFIGSLLQVKPVLYFRDKIIIPFEKIRTRKKALKRIVEIFDEQASKGIPMEAVVVHANREEEAKELERELKELYPHVEFRISYFGPVIGTHLGEGSLALGWYTK